jgi:predicted DsbA family dithiol-disulfide isomerase
MPALRASKVAALQGKGKWNRFHLAVMKAFYTDGRDVSNENVIEEIAEETGLAMEEFTKELRNPKWQKIVYEETRQAQEIFGIRSIPTVIVQNSYLVEGVVAVSYYRKVVEEMRRSL